MQKLKKIFFCCVNVSMSFITIEAYKNTQVHTITVKSNSWFWIKMNDMQNGLGMKNIFDLTRKEMQGIYETQNPTKEQIKKHQRS